jgi:hypothetical protein
MSAVAPPRPLLGLRDATETHGIAAVCRARDLVATVGGRHSLELGIEVDRGPDEIERWALAATLLGSRISPAVALRSYRALEHAGIRTIADARCWERDELVTLLDEGAHARYDDLTASRLLALAHAVSARFGGRLASAWEECANSSELRAALESLPGWGPVTVRTFMRELRGVWPVADVPLDRRAVAAARHLQLPDELTELASLAVAAHLDVRDLEAGLVRLALCHDLGRCPGGEECPFAGHERSQPARF